MTEAHRAAPTTSEHAEAKDDLWKLYSENVAQARHHEAQRSTVVGLILAISTGILGVIALDKGIKPPIDTALALLLVLLGLFGATFSFKHYERFRLHMRRARGYREALDSTLAGRPLRAIKKAADEEIAAAFPVFSRLRLHHWWVALNLMISTVGLSLTFISVFAPIQEPGSSSANGTAVVNRASAEDQLREAAAPEK